MSAFAEWLESGTIKRRQVNLYADAAIMDEMAALSSRIDEAKATEKRDIENGDRSMADKSVLPELEAQAEALWEKYEASKSVWHVRATTAAERDLAFEAHPSTAEPSRPRLGGTADEKKAWEQSREEWAKREARAELDRRLFLLSKVVERVEVGGRDIDAVTVTDLRALLNAAYGPERIKALWAAVADASEQGEAPLPFSQRDSESTLD